MTDETTNDAPDHAPEPWSGGSSADALGTGTGTGNGTLIHRRRVVGGVVSSVIGVAGGVAIGKKIEDRRRVPTGPVIVKTLDSPVAFAHSDAMLDGTNGYDDSDALARLLDLQVAYELADDFPGGVAGERVGSLGWIVKASGVGSGLQAPASGDGGVIALTTGSASTGRSAIGLDVRQLSGAPLFTMEFRLRLVHPKAGGQQVLVGAVDELEGVSAYLPKVGFFFRTDVARQAWTCGVSSVKGSRTVETEVPMDDTFHRMAVTSDGSGLIRYYVDDQKVASFSEVEVDPAERYGHGASITNVAHPRPKAVEIDWFFVRRELVR